MTTEIAQRNPQAELRYMLEKAAPKMQEVMPKHLDAERLVRITTLAVQRTPDLLKCHPLSVLTSVMIAARLGLDTDGVLGSAYLVPFYNRKTDRKEAQLIIGYRGLIDLARRSGDVSFIESRLVYTNDHFTLDYGTGSISHVPELKCERGEWYCCWAMATHADGTRQIEVMTRDEIDFIKNQSKAKYGPWFEDDNSYREMARKTVVRRLAKYLPLSPEMAVASLLQAGAEAGESNVRAAAQSLDLDLGLEPEEQPESAVEALAEVVAGPKEEPPPNEEEPPPIGEERTGGAALTPEEQFDRCETQGALDDAWNENRSVIDALSKHKKSKVRAAYDARVVEIHGTS